MENRAKTSRDAESGVSVRGTATTAKTSAEYPDVPDGGIHAWIIVVASFLTNGIIFGIHNCYGILYIWLKEELERSGVSDAATKSSLVGSLSIGMTFFVSPLAGILTDSLGLRRTAILGGAIATLGMLASSFALNHVWALYVTYGILFGAGTSLAYNPSLVILGHYFRRRLGLVNGIVTAGSSVFTISLPFFLDAILARIGLSATLQVLSGIMGLLMICALSYVPILPPAIATSDSVNSRETKCQQLWRKYIDFTIWKNKKYVIWAIAVPISMLGYFVPYVHLVAYVKDILPEADGKLLVLCIGVTSFAGRLIFGKIGDLPRVNRVILQQSAFLAIGIFTMLLTLADSFAWLITLCLFMGLFDGCFVALVGPIAFDLCGPQSASQAIGFLLGLYSVPMTTGPPVAGALYESLGTYQVAFLLAGCPPILCALIMCFIRGVKDDRSPADSTFAGQVATADKSLGKRKISQIPSARPVDVNTAAPEAHKAYSSVYATPHVSSGATPEPSQADEAGIVPSNRKWSPFRTISSRRFNVNSADPQPMAPAGANGNVALTNYTAHTISW